MNYNIYIDESGNTGNIELRDNLEWNYSNQTHFALGAFYMEDIIAEDIEYKIVQILHKYDSELGTEKELKSKAKYKFKNELIDEITKLLLDNKVDFYFDIANKKYKVIMNLVEYCVYPYFVDEKNIWDRGKKVNAANFLYKTLPLEIIKRYIDLCQGTYDEEESVQQLIDFLNILDGHYANNNQKVNPIDSVLQVVKDYKKYGLNVDNLFPVKDHNNKGIKESFLPNVDAYNNIIASIGNLRLKRYNTINIYHDEQKQFSQVLMEWTRYLKQNNININKLDFAISKENILIQIADYYTGSIIRLYRKIVEYEILNKSDRELIKIIKPLLGKCNIVAPNNEVEEFFNKCGIKYGRTPIPF